MTKHALHGSYASQIARGAQGLLGPEDQLCQKSHYATIVEAQKYAEIYGLGDVDCPNCLRLMADKHAALAEVFRERLETILGSDPQRCRIYDTACINPSFCAARDACCAGDPDCGPSVKHEETP